MRKLFLYPHLALATFISITTFTIVAFGGPASDFAKDLKSKLRFNQRVAITYIYDAKSFNITAYGNLWRDKVSTALNLEGIKVVSRKELGILMEDITSFEDTKKSGDDLNNLNVDVLIMGSYYLEPCKTMVKVEMVLKGINLKNFEILTSRNFSIQVPLQNAILLTQVLGNLRDNKMEKIGTKTIFLDASLNKACFSPGEKAYIKINTQPGMYVYIFNIAADGSVVRILPNSIFKEMALPVGEITFPPPKIHNLSLVMAAYPNIDPAYESFRIIVSKHPLKEEGFPIPDNQIIIGNKARTIKDLYHLVANNKDIAIKDLPYLVGESCRKTQ